MTSIVPVYSIAKPYTAISALLSFETNQKLGELIADLPDPVASLTLHDVLTHRSGLNDYFVWRDYRAAVDAREAPWPEADIIARAEVVSPGSFRYSNIGYLLLRLALERRHSCSIFEVLQRLVFGPLDIQAYRFAELEDWDRCDHPGIDNRLRSYHPRWVYTGTFAADPMEAARGLALVMAGGLGSDLARRLQETVEVPVGSSHPMAPNAGYGLGLMTSGAPVSVVGHGGQGPGLNLFAAASIDGSRWRGEVDAAEGENLDLIRRCVESARA